MLSCRGDLRLEARGVACWMAPRDVLPGRDYGEQIIEAIEAAAVTLLVLSEHANASRHVRNEIERAVAKAKAVLPVRIREVLPSKALELFVSSSAPPACRGLQFGRARISRP